MKSLSLHSKKQQSIERRHPWVFSGAIRSEVTDLRDGEVVRLLDSKGDFLAIGHFQHATISVRLLSFDDVVIDQGFWHNRIEQAVRLRRDLNLFRPDNNIMRLVHGEGDQLPGLVIDYYGGVAVIQCHSIGMFRSLEEIGCALQDVLSEELKAIYVKTVETLPERCEAQDGFIFEEVPVPHKAMENGISYVIDWIKGQKTGFFIDQRENRAALGRYVEHKSVLNTFCYSGGFSLMALKNGAKEVVSLDSSAKALQLTEEHVKLNAFPGLHKIVKADAMEYIKTLGKTFDVIVLDPPAFAKHKDKRHKAVQGYKRLNVCAMRSIRSGGFIFTFSCSQVVDKQLFFHTIVSAGIESGRNIRIIEQLHQPADHPISAFHPEGEYLKGLVVQVL